MQILITGAAGFLGWNLSRELRQRHPDAMIVGVDDLWTGVRRREEWVSKMVEDRIQWWFGSDMSGTQTYGLFDYIYHLASPASPSKYQSDPLRTVHANVGGLFQCADLYLRPGGVILFTSSSEVYGDPLVSPQPESYRGSVSCTGPRSCYDESKRLCESILMDYRRMHGTRVKIARLFNVYGPGTLPDDGRCMSNFVWQAMNGQSLTIYGDGRQTRAFTYVDDVVRALVRLAEETGDFTGPVNIGTDQETSVKSVASAVLAETMKWWELREYRGPYPVVPPTYLPAPVDDPRQRLPDLTLAREVLGWRPERLVQIWGDRGGIRRTIDHFAEEYRCEADHHDTGAAVGAADPGGSA